MVTYYQCKLHGRSIIQPEDFGLVYAIEDVCNFFRWRDREDVDIRSKYVISRLAKRIKELEEVLASYESRVESLDSSSTSSSVRSLSIIGSDEGTEEGGGTVEGEGGGTVEGEGTVEEEGTVEGDGGGTLVFKWSTGSFRRTSCRAGRKNRSMS
ncbi:hypothetical protein H5410_048596 [Solanum commersonii]|uniref:Uncharacterized protein n=1 Tax=Solanum commersonii TaxID=4109 RepID=A0A9J5XKA5_SOLCO|nr:hypothetical protein H5410_048596 [Solanum commersonii]